MGLIGEQASPLHAQAGTPLNVHVQSILSPFPTGTEARLYLLAYVTSTLESGPGLTPEGLPGPGVCQLSEAFSVWVSFFIVLQFI